MKGGIRRALLLATAVMPAAWGQFQLYLVSGSLEQPVAPLYDFGPIEPGLSASAQFRIRNTGTSASMLDLLSVRGSGFTMTSGPALPAILAPQKSVDFTVVFQSAGTGGYSASLDSVGISVLLTATVHSIRAPVSRFRRRGRGRAGGKAEIGKAESRNRKAEGAAVSGSFLPSTSSCSSRPCFLTPLVFPFLPPVSAFSVSASQLFAACWAFRSRIAPAASQATCAGSAAGGM